MVGAHETRQACLYIDAGDPIAVWLAGHGTTASATILDLRDAGGHAVTITGTLAQSLAIALDHHAVARDAGIDRGVRTLERATALANTLPQPAARRPGSSAADDRLPAGDPIALLRRLVDRPGRLRPAAEGGERGLLARGGWNVCFVELTQRCNERCVHCYADSSPEATAALDRATLEQVVEDVAAMGFARIQFTGGDPLISPDLEPLVDRARALGIPEIEIYTNALALQPTRMRWLLERGCTFAVSLYSHDAAEHDAITQVPGSHRRTSRHVRAAVDAGAYVRVSVIRMGANGGPIEDTIRYVNETLGVPRDRIGVDTVHDVGRGTDVEGGGGSDEQNALSASPGAPVARGQAVPSIHGGGGPLRPGGSGEGSAENGWEGWWQGKLAVAPTGEVFPCIFGRFLSLGSVLDRPLRDIATSPRPRLLDGAVTGGAPPQNGAPDDSGGLLPLWSVLSSKLQCTDCRLATAALILGATNAAVGASARADADPASAGALLTHTEAGAGREGGGLGA